MLLKNSLAVALLITAVCVSQAVAEDTAPQIGAPAPQFSLQDQDGNVVTLPTDKVVVLEWFNNECPIVERHYENNAMNELAAKYTGKGVVWLAINSTNGKTNADNQKAAAAWKMSRPILNDAPGTVGHTYAATNTPGMYVVNNGILAYMGAIDDKPKGGGAAKNYVAQALDEILAGKPVSEPKTKQYGCTVKYGK